MLARPNALQWHGQPGHYEVYYVTFTDRRTGIGVWIRYTLLAPRRGSPESPTCALWFVAVDPRPAQPTRLARKVTLPIGELASRPEPFELRIDGALLTDRGMRGTIEDVHWDLSWTATGPAYEHVHPALRRTGIAETVLVLPHADLAIEGTVELPGETLELSGARGGQAHLWGSKHATSWAWVHCSDFTDPAGSPVRDTLLDAVSVIVSRMGREIGPSTPVVGRVRGEDFISTSPLRVLANDSTFALTGWRFEATDGRRKLIAEVDADRDQLAGVTYHDPDGERAYCYNGETATMRLQIHDKARRVGGWLHRETLLADRSAHFEYAQRSPIAGLELLTA